MTIGRIPSVEGGIQPTIVDAKGDLIAATAADTVNRLAVGSNDQVLVADSSTSTGLAWKSYGLQTQNPVLNAAFQVWQRGTSGFVGGTSAATGFCADRWQVTRGGYASGLTASRQTTSDTTNLPFIQYCVRVQRDSGNTSNATLALSQSFESVNSIPFAGRTVTLSFYARAGANYSATSNALTFRIDTGTGTDQNLINGYTGGASSLTSTATLTTTWQRFSATATMPTGTTELGIYFAETPTGTAGANDYYEVTGVQLEVGSVPTPFKTYAATLQGELAAAMRYYQTFSALGFIVCGQAAATNEAVAQLQLMQTMRVAPTITLAATGNGTGQIRFLTAATGNPATPGTIAASNATTNSFRAYCTGATSAYTAGDATTLFIGGAGEQTVYTASAEL